MYKNLKDFLLGKALTDDALKGEKLSRLWGLPIMASDAVSSVAYAVEEILMALIFGTVSLGMHAVQYVGLVSLPIILLLIMLVFSYSQIISHYPSGGGAYAVTQENFGRRPSLLAAACLIVDYIMTVAVSISSSTAAIIAAFPALESSRVLIAMLSVLLITLINLRGVNESSKVFGVPTYLFIVSMGIFIVTGFVRLFSGTLQPIDYAGMQSLIPQETLTGITLVLFLRAFSAGCSALTGVEAVSNAVPSFREPSTRTARHVLYLLGIVIIFIFGGTSILATMMKVVPLHGVTVMSQMANAIFGTGFMFYLLQFTTSLILLLAANTAYNGLPILLAILAQDRYMPRQFAQRGAKLSFSNGIVFIFFAASILLLVFRADTHALIPFYAAGVLVSFTLSQAGMFIKWVREKEQGWQYKCLINGLGALVTFIGSIVVFLMKFASGAWALLIAIPLIMYFMSYTHRHYFRLGQEISMEGYDYRYTPSKSQDDFPCIVLIHNMNKAALKTFNYAKDLSRNVTALHISTSSDRTEELREQWAALGIGVPLVVIPAPYRDILQPLEQYVSQREAMLGKGENLTVVLTKFVGSGWHDEIFHNQTTFFIEKRLVKHKNVVTVLVPYLYDRNDKK